MATFYPSLLETWYPSNPKELNKIFTQSFLNVPSIPPNNKIPAKILVLPHAGLMYSCRGQLGSLQYLQKDISSVLILSPSHRAPLPANRLVWSSVTTWQTPLGELPGISMERLVTNKYFVQDPGLIQQEHGIELMLPALAWKTKDWEDKPQIGALVCPSSPDPNTLKDLASVLCHDIFPYLPKPWVLVVSSDFCHYGPRFGFTPWGSFSQEKTREKVKQEDLSIARLACTGEYEKIIAQLAKPSMPTICGIVPLLLALLAISEDRPTQLQGRIMDYYHSDEGGRAENAVAYCSMAFF
jgi:AmmeMemoRadiSam system protein B